MKRFYEYEKAIFTKKTSNCGGSKYSWNARHAFQLISIFKFNLMHTNLNIERLVVFDLIPLTRLYSKPTLTYMTFTR